MRFHSNLGRLRGGRQGWTATPAPPARGVAPGNPNLMLGYAKRFVRMLTGKVEQAAANADFGTQEACTGATIMQQASIAGGLGARCAPNGEREGQSHLASLTSALRQSTRAHLQRVSGAGAVRLHGARQGAYRVRRE